MSNKKNRIVIFSMDDPEITYLFFHSLIQSNIEIHKVFFLENPKINTRRLISIFVSFGINFYSFFIKYFYWNLIKGGRVKKLLDVNEIYNQKFNNKEFDKIAKILNSSEVDIILSIFCNAKIPDFILKKARITSINMHLGILPKYRGLMPTFYSMINNEKYMGYSIHYMNDKFDSGDILKSDKIEINYKKNYYTNLINLVKFSSLDLSMILKTDLNKIKNIKKNDLAQGSYYGIPKIFELINYLIIFLKKIK